MKSTPSGRVVAEYTCDSRWLLELFLPGPGNSTGFYVETLAEDGMTYTTTVDPWRAKRFTKDEAKAAALRVLSKLGVFLAIEHGFCNGG